MEQSQNGHEQAPDTTSAAGASGASAPSDSAPSVAARGSEIQRLVAEMKQDLSIAEHYALDRLAAIGHALEQII